MGSSSVGPPENKYKNFLVSGPTEKCFKVHIHHQIIPQMPFPWPNSIQITVFVCEKPSEKTFRPNDLMPGFCKTICAQDQNLYHRQIGAIPKSSPGFLQQRGCFATSESLSRPRSRTARRPPGHHTGHGRKRFCTISRNGIFYSDFTLTHLATLDVFKKEGQHDQT